MANNTSPRDTMLDIGSCSMSDSELIKIIIGNGCNGHNYNSISADFLNAIRLHGLYNISIDEVLSIKGIGKSKACSIIAMIELCSRYTC